MSNSRDLKSKAVHRLYKNSGEIKKVFIPHNTVIGTNKAPKSLKVKKDLIVTGSAYISGTLNVYSGSNFTYNTLTIESNSGETDYGLHIKRDSGSSAFMIKLENEDASATDAPMFGIFHQDDGDFTIGESYDDYKLHIQNDGKVGIGEPTPGEMLHIDGAATHTRIRLETDDGYDMLITGYQASTQKFGFGYDDSENVVSLSYGSMGAHHVNIDASGLVGIGTTSPTELLDVDSDAIRIRDSQTPSTSVGASGDYEGMIAWDTSYLYVCTADYDGSTDVWKRSAIATW